MLLIWPYILQAILVCFDPLISNSGRPRSISAENEENPIKVAYIIIGWSLALGAFTSPSWAIDVQISDVVIGSTPKVVGYGIAHYFPGGNTQSWWKYSGANGARIWSSPPDVEDNDDIAPWGDGVTNQTQFVARKAALRASPLSPVFIDWNDFNNAFANETSTGSNTYKLEYAAQSLTEIENDLLIVMQRRVGSFDWPSSSSSNSTSDWNDRWEAWQHWYAQAFYYAKNYDTERFQIYNEPDHSNADPLTQTQWLEMSQFAADAVESALADVNAIYGKSLSARMHAAVTAGGPDLNSSGYGTFALTNLHRPLFSTQDVPGYDLFKTFDYHQYTTSASSFASNISAATNTINAGTGNQASDYGLAISEFHVYTNGTWPASLTPDSPSVYLDLGDMLGAAANAGLTSGPKELYLFKFGTTGNANYTHYLDDTAPYNVGGVTKSGQVYHLFAKGFAGNELLTVPTPASGTFSMAASRNAETGARYLYSTHTGTGTSTKILDIDLSSWNVTQGTRIIVEQVSENFHGEISQVILVGANQQISVVQDPGSTVLVSIPGPGPRSYATLTATDDALVKSGSNSNVNYGSSSSLLAKNHETNANARNVSFIKFDLGDMETEDVDQALLRVFGQNTGSAANVIAHVYGILDDTWDEETITWNNAPNLAAGLGTMNDISHNFIEDIGGTASILGHFTGSASGKELFLDVTELIQDHPDSAVSFLIAREVRFDGENVSDSLTALQLSSKEDEGDFGPQLLLSLLPPALPADFNKDGYVDTVDLGLWQSGYGIAAGANRLDGDANGDGVVDGTDFLQWQRQVGTFPTPPLQSVPEPSTLMLSIGLLMTALTGRFSAACRLPRLPLVRLSNRILIGQYAVGALRLFVLSWCCTVFMPNVQAAEGVQENLPEELSKEDFHVYLLVGQSNMAGRGELADGDELPQQGIFALDKDGKWKAASHPLHFDKPKIAGYGLGIDFAKQMREQDDSIAIGLIPSAVGGTTLKEWSRGGALYESAIVRAKLASQRGKLKGILWHQGEGDCNEAKARTYRERLSELIANFREDLDAPDLPFVLGELGHFRIGKKKRSDIVIQQQQSVPIHVSHTACASAEGLGQKGDYAHFDRKALQEFGVRYAQAMIALQSNSESEDELVPRDPTLYHEGWIDFNKNGTKDTYEDRHATTEDRIEDLLSQMNVNEKTCQLVTLYGYKRVMKDDLPTSQWENEIWKDGLANIDEHMNGIPGWRNMPESKYVWPASQHARAINEVQRWFLEETRLGIPVDFTNEGIRGLCHHRATNFPAQVGVGATWNKKLAADIGRVTGTEAKALGYTNIYSPILDVARDPRWGRVVECYGEDPFLVASMGVQQALGLMESGVASTAKHFAVYSVPKGGRDGEARTDPHIAPREMEQIYLAPFAAAIRDAGIQGVMSSYNDYDGVPVSGSRKMLIDKLRDEMGFRGYVVSDSDAVRYLHSKHRVASSPKDAVRLFLESGGNVRTEFRSPEGFVLPLRELIQEGQISMDVVDDRVRDVLRVKFELGLFDTPYVASSSQANKIVHNPIHRETAFRAARESIVLLKNADKILPLKKDIESILVCGPNSQEIGHSICRYGPTGGEVISVVDGIKSVVSPDTAVHYALGAKIADARWPESELFYEPPTGEDQQLIAEAVELAKKVDVIVAVLGESELTIGESKSRTDLNLTGYQRELVQALHQTGKPIVVVLLNGRALSINWIDRHVPGIIEAWFPGEACGRAIADVLFGDYNPGGKLPVTVPRTVGQLPYNFPFKPGSQAGQGTGHNPNGVGNSRIMGAIYPFGFGLSYTTFAYSDLKISLEEIKPGDAIKVKCRVTNTGDRAGDEVVQLYLRDDISSVTTYDTMLRGFERIHLEPRESKVVSFELDFQDMALLDSEMKWVVEPGKFSVFVGSSSEDHRLNGSFEVSASEETLAAERHSASVSYE